MVQNLRNSIWNSNLTYHQFKDIQANFITNAQFISLLLLFQLTQEQKDSNQNEILVMV